MHPSRPRYGPHAEQLGHYAAERVDVSFWAVISRGYKGDPLLFRQAQELGRLLSRHD
jgi:hypothetical protein